MAASAHATVTMNLSSGSSPGGAYFASLEGAAFIGYYGSISPANEIVTANELVGIYEFTVTASSGPTLNSPYYATCISPAGDLTTASVTYTQTSFANAAPGANPALWSGLAGPDGGYGIQNANYLYQELASTIIHEVEVNGNKPAYDNQAAAMALAMYTALYNSTGYGTYNASGPFQLPYLALDPTVQALYNYDLNTVLPGMNPNLVNPYGVLVPDQNPITGQDLILLGGYQDGYPVPEPSTVIAGALLLLPFGASTMRIIRRKSAV
jgi:hypothetical protein